MGFALENYDAVGRWRDQDGKHAVDASAELPDGTRFDGPIGLKEILLARKHEFIQCYSEKMLTYALGRGLEHYDQCAIRKIVDHVADNDHRFSAVIAAVVESVPFQYRQVAQQRKEGDE